MCKEVKQNVLKAENEGKEENSLTSAFSSGIEKAYASLTVSTTIVADEGGSALCKLACFGLFFSLCALFSPFVCCLP